MGMSKKRKSIQDMLRRRFGWSTWQMCPGCPVFQLPKAKGLSYRNGFINGKPQFYTDMFGPRIEIGTSKNFPGGLEYTIALDRYIKENGAIRMCQMTPGEREHCCFWFRMSFDEIKALYEMGLALKSEEEQDE